MIPDQSWAAAPTRVASLETLDILKYMKQILIEIEDDVAARLEAVAPGRTRRRSEFVRMAIRRALWCALLPRQLRFTRAGR